jgi:hypothetical protein
VQHAGRIILAGGNKGKITVKISIPSGNLSHLGCCSAEVVGVMGGNKLTVLGIPPVLSQVVSNRCP